MNSRICLVVALAAGIANADVSQHHNDAARTGVYVDPLITQAAAANTHRDLSFRAPIPGPTYAQPLYAESGPDGLPTLFVATEQNQVLALSAYDGSVIWQSDLGTPVRRAQLPCGNIDPVGITGTPVIDIDSRTLYVAAMTTPDGGATKRHRIFALSIDDGSTGSGWPVDVDGLSYGGNVFNSTVQNQRAALLLVNGILYVSYGGHWGDCGTYYGWVIGVPIADPSNPVAWATGARGGGIWAPGGLASDGTSIFAETGNTFGAASWMGGEAMIRFDAGPAFSGAPADYFAPSNWRALDSSDLDVGGANPILFDVPGASPSALAVALGKNGVAYLHDRYNLGGIGTGDGINGEGLYSARVNSGQIITAPATYTAPTGQYVVFTSYSGAGVGCPGSAGTLVSLAINATTPPSFNVAWCANNLGRGAPMVTTTDGTSDPIVWSVGSESSNRLRAFNAETGEVLFDGGGSNELMTTVRRFQTPIAVNGRIFVAADNELYAFTTQ